MIKKYFFACYNYNKIYTNTMYGYKKYDIWDYTYGNPIIRDYQCWCVLKIGKFCSIAWNVTIMLWWNHRTEWISTYPFNILWKWFDHIVWHPSCKWDVIIWNDVWIWNNVTIMSWVTIWDGSVIALWSIVTKDIEPYSIVWWVPAKFIKYRFETDVIEKLLHLERWNRDTEKIKKNIEVLQSANYDVFNW